MTQTLVVFVWLAATVGHFLLAARFFRKMLGPGASIDEQAFVTTLAGIGTLSVVLHLLASTGALSLTYGLVALAGSHVLLLSISPRVQLPHSPAGDAPAVPGLGQILAGVTLVAIVFAWVDVASQSAAVAGTDAAHYHVPVAVNLALGAGLFDLPATPHLYPMAASVIEAWFIIPLRSPLIVDLAMCLPFALLVVSMNWIFRLATGQSGLAWASWVCLALFATPLFRSSSLVSADLWFASSFVATAALLMSVNQRRSWRAIDVILAGLAFGLLLGTKTTGTAAAAILVGVYLLWEAVSRIVVKASLPQAPRHPFGAALALVALTLGAGGIWLIRNWHQFGSPIAPTGLSLFGIPIFSGEPFQPTTYLSVLGDLEKDAAYDLPRRAGRFIRVWLGEWYVPVLSLIIFLLIDLAVAWTRRRELSLVAARSWLLLVTFGGGSVLVWLLVGAPWTSLEWTRGLSLRYALPIAALLPLVAFISLFPLSFRWYDDRLAVLLALAAIVVACGYTFYAANDPDMPRFVGVPPISFIWWGVALAAVLVWRSTPHRTGPVVTGLMAAVLVAVWAPLIAGRAEREQAAAVAREVRPGSPARDVYLLTLANERETGRTCERRRFFSLARLDEPLMLQSSVYGNQVFYAGRDLRTTRRAAPLERCDYIISTPALMGTEKGTALIAVLASGARVQQLNSAGPYVVLTRP